jgi:hypothetical protein
MLNVAKSPSCWVSQISTLCWVSKISHLCWVFLCWVSLCWMLYITQDRSHCPAVCRYLLSWQHCEAKAYCWQISETKIVSTNCNKHYNDSSFKITPKLTSSACLCSLVHVSPYLRYLKHYWLRWNSHGQLFLAPFQHHYRVKFVISGACIIKLITAVI